MSKQKANPENIIGEILGSPARMMRNPVNAGYECPFISSQCVKRSQRSDGPYPVCSIWHGSGSRRKLICVCPKRFYQADFLQDVVNNCWIGEKPNNPIIVHEVKMEKLGNVDFVIADRDRESGEINKFVSVELQAVDITGSVEPAYQGVINSAHFLDKKPSYGINWANVRKRYITQLINKGFFHHHWNTRIVAVVQDALYFTLQKASRFDELPPSSPSSNIVFMLYDFQPEENEFRITFKRAVGTSHNSLMMAAIYSQPPSIDKFKQRILSRLQQG